MSLKKESMKLIESLNEGGLYAECPCCRETFALENTGLFYLDEFSPQATEHTAATPKLIASRYLINSLFMSPMSYLRIAFCTFSYIEAFRDLQIEKKLNKNSHSGK